MIIDLFLPSFLLCYTTRSSRARAVLQQAADRPPPGPKTPSSLPNWALSASLAAFHTEREELLNVKTNLTN